MPRLNFADRSEIDTLLRLLATFDAFSGVSTGDRNFSLGIASQ
jgi:hypothetical protein